MFPEGRALEFLLAAVVALVVVGPKDLPILMRKLGQFLGKMRAMAAEFRASFDEMARQSELDELRKEVESMRKAQFADVAAQAGQAEVQDVFTDIRQDLDSVSGELHGRASAPPPLSAETVDVAPSPAAPAEPAPAAKKPRAPRKSAAAATTAPKTAAKPRARKKAEPEA